MYIFEAFGSLYMLCLNQINDQDVRGFGHDALISIITQALEAKLLLERRPNRPKSTEVMV